VRTKTQPVFHRALALAAFALLPALAAAQEAAPKVDPLPATMTPYTETVPGFELTFDMVPIPGGTYLMGSPADEEDRNDDEGPQHPVKINPFWMGKNEVTWDEYDIFAFSYDLKRPGAATATTTGSKADAVTRPTPPYADQTFGFGRRGQPAICITHHSAMEYCRWLSEKTGKLYRLPTEAEWEWAARGGTSTPFSFDPEEIDDYAWYVENAEKPMPVGKKKPNPFGLHDIHGNVSEWVIDHYVADQYAKASQDTPTLNPVVLPSEKEYPYVVRGGSWDDDAEGLRSAVRRSSNLEWSIQDPQRPQSIWWHTDATFVGFRIVRPLEEQENLKGLRSKVVKGNTTR
jgi:formylglycine-generating enzyme required for sulfatase activity